ncbi:glycosyltransferase family 4 protein [Xylanibacter caecicola]|uniref:glycosyltransferase family 4 protein n=1 Tax=Xylanibacter caecicola TaxID=2736294 RepID=UPI002592A784|nr:glycosyltransferase family 4 protein [Xylanibacter caecicola]
MKNVKKINIITSPFGCIPPHAIGAVEKRWKSCGDYYMAKGLEVCFLSKNPEENNVRDDTFHRYIKGYGRTGSWTKDLFLDFIYSVKALWKMPKCDAVVLNTIWSPILLPFFRWKYKVSLYNVARFPKKQFGFYKAVDILSCVSCSVYNCLMEQTPKAKKQACVISNFIDTEIYHPYREHSLPLKPMLLYTGRVHREKGIELLVEAINMIRKNHDVTLKIIGAWDTPRGGSGKEYKDELDKLADGWQIDWVEPIYNSKHLAEEMDKCDVYCYPSLADKGETFGVAPLEAMGLGIPTIVSDLDCFKDFITDKISGLIFDHHAEDAVKQLYDCISYVIENEKHYAEISQKGVMSSSSFNVAQKAEEYFTVLNNMLNYQKTGFNTEESKNFDE